MVGVIAKRNADNVVWLDADILQVASGPEDQTSAFPVSNSPLAVNDCRMRWAPPRVVKDCIRNVFPALRVWYGHVFVNHGAPPEGLHALSDHDWSIARRRCLSPCSARGNRSAAA